MDSNLLSEAELQALLQEATVDDDDPGGLPALQQSATLPGAAGLAEVAELKEVVRQLQIRMEFLEQLLQGHLKETEAGLRSKGISDVSGGNRGTAASPAQPGLTSVSAVKPLPGLPSRKVRHSRRGGRS